MVNLCDSDDLAGHEPDCSITTLVNLYNKYKKNMMIYIYILWRVLNLLYVMVNVCAFG